MHPALATLPAWACPYVGKGTPGRGLIYNHPESQYHGTKALISKSSLDLLAVTPMHYRAHLDAPLEDRNLPQFRIGGAYHVGVLEPDLFAQKVIVMPNFGPMQSSTNRKVRDNWITHEAQGRIYLTAAEYAQVVAMRDVLLRSPLGRKILGRGFTPEVTALWTCPETGLRCKARADSLHSDQGIFIDLKSAFSAAPWAFRRAAAEHRYMVQDAFYSRAFEENDILIEHFIFLVQEKEHPYAYAAYQLNDTARARGEELYMRELRQLRHCIDLDIWPSYAANEDVMPLDIPPWATRDWEVGA